MNIEVIENAVQLVNRLRLTVADGDEFKVPHPDHISVPPKSSSKRTFVFVYNDEGLASYLPLLTIPSLTYEHKTSTIL